MAKKINGVILTEKGALKNAVRTGIAEKVVPSVENALSDLGFEKDEKNSFTLEYVDLKGNHAYATLTLTIGVVAPSDRAEKKPSKKVVKTSETFDIE